LYSFSDLPALLRAAPAIWVSVRSVQGSGPREVGAWMAVTANDAVGTVGGGHLEFEAMRLAREALLDGALNQPAPFEHRFALGPSLGQCCGGVVVLGFEPIGLGDLPRLEQQVQAHAQPVALFGGGHVGKALIEVLGRLPMAVLWVDSRDEIFPAQVPANVRCEHSDPVQQAVWDLPAGCHVLMMSFSHAEDLDILAACLLRARQQQDLPYIGLIGSDTKWATFRHRLEAKGFGPDDFARVTCPIGIPGIEGKQPEVIAVAVAAQLLQR
jgi:xanthine dehydrogenase accessory factor